MTDMKIWDRETIAKWNLYRFPSNTELRQKRKVVGEIKEFHQAKDRDHKLEELADVYISFAGLSRFSVLGEFVCDLFEQLPDFEILLKPQINAKMIINNRRRFDRNMQHLINSEPKDYKSDTSSVGAGLVEPEYITVKKSFNCWQKDEKGKWNRVKEPDEFEVLKSEWYKEI